MGTKVLLLGAMAWAALGLAGCNVLTGGCDNDSNCKGSRVCDHGRCVEPDERGGGAALAPAGAGRDPAPAAAPDPAQVAREMRRQQAEQRAQERARVLQSPDKYLDTSNLKYHDKGIINSYRQLVALDVLNKSRFPIANMRGEVSWLDASNRVVGTLPLTLTGSLAAGESRTFSSVAGTLSSGVLQSDATTARIRITSIEIPQAE